VGLANLDSELETCVGSRVRLVGVFISFEKNFYRLPFTPPLSGSPYWSFRTPLVGWVGTIEIPPATSAVTEQPTTTAAEEAASQPQENGNLEGEDDDELLIPLEVHSVPEDGSPRE
jgi:hypothetical protein